VLAASAEKGLETRSPNGIEAASARRIRLLAVVADAGFLRPLDGNHHRRNNRHPGRGRPGESPMAGVPFTSPRL
jgi:hypothetical protein